MKILARCCVESIDVFKWYCSLCKWVSLRVQMTILRFQILRNIETKERYTVDHEEIKQYFPLEFVTTQLLQVMITAHTMGYLLQPAVQVV